MAVDSILTVFHQEDSKAGRVGDRLLARGYQLEACCPAVGDELPSSPQDYAGIISFGGGMSANDEHLPFIKAELDWLPQVIAAEVPLLGICLGAQLIARVLGGEVKPHVHGRVEIGYCSVRPTPEGLHLFDGIEVESFYQWHREGFELVPEMTHLAEGDAFEGQAFRHGLRTYGLQFHPEATREMIDRHLDQASHMLQFPGAQPRSQILEHHDRAPHSAEQWIDRLLDVWLPAAKPLQAQCGGP